MRASYLIHLAALPLLATSQIGNFLSLWTNHACSAPLDEIELPATGCTNLTEFDVFSISAAIVSSEYTSTSKLFFPSLSLRSRSRRTQEAGQWRGNGEIEDCGLMQRQSLDIKSFDCTDGLWWWAARLWRPARMLATMLDWASRLRDYAR